MAEATAHLGQVDISYETFGDSADPAMLLVMGLGTQMLGWDAGFCELLVERGFFVIRFDNRDVGRSSWIEDAPRPDVPAAMTGDFSSAAYTLSDMAADALGLLDHLGVESAHVVGASMGGMIAQTIAIEHPERVLSLTSIMSTTGDRAVGQPAPEGLAALMRTPPNDREGYAESAVEAFRAIGSKGFEIDEDYVRQRALASHDRGYNPLGVARQLLAIGASGDRTERLRELDVPTLVVHGRGDPLVSMTGGEATAAAIPGAKLELVEGMGHDLPRGTWRRLADLIAENAARAVPSPG
jgi:pimeloyl-ACP methyl ester carboxylesterase